MLCPFTSSFAMCCVPSHRFMPCCGVVVVVVLCGVVVWRGAMSYGGVVLYGVVLCGGVGYVI